MLAARQICKARFEAFGTAGQAGRLKAVPLEAMAEKYAKGEIKAVVN
jgi:fructose-bisphosphate aldolase class II